MIKHVKKALKNAEQIQKDWTKNPSLNVSVIKKDYVAKVMRRMSLSVEKNPNIVIHFSRNEMVQRERGRTIAHELSHNVGTRDHTYSQDEIKDVKWWNNASSFNTWMKHGKFCIPGWKDCF